MRPVFALCLALPCLLSCSQPEASLAAPVAEVEANTDISGIQKRLRGMALADDKIRVELDTVFAERSTKGADGSAAFKSVYMRMRQQDIAHSEELGEIVAKYGWIDSDRFGKQASHDAWLITQHMVHDKGVFQKQMASLMEPGKTADPKQYALLKDRIAVIFDKHLQEYGTQGKCQDNGDWTAIPIRDANKLNERRLAIGLEVFEKYETRMDAKCLKRFEK